jgi:putative Mg2+ transporter-C (MgtC) family protein
MEPMPLAVSAEDLALRLVLTVAAGALIGFNRDERGHAAGLRTTMLVCLAASIAMLQANLLLSTGGKAEGDFAVADVLRLPLGILSGIGFIGAGAIVRRSNLVEGVTTAATLWVVTVVGLCFGGGQIILGCAGTVLTFLVLWALKVVENRLMHRERRATLVLVADTEGPGSSEIADLLGGAGLRIVAEAVTYLDQANTRETRYDLRWRSQTSDTRPPALLFSIASRSGVRKLLWSPQGIAPA